MRQLNKKQKKLLDKTFKDDPDISKFQDLSLSVINEIEEINDHETLFQNVDRYLEDLYMEGT